MLAPYRQDPEDDAVPDAPPPVDIAGVAVFFDLDGTLIEIADRPDAVEVPHALLASLVRLATAAPGRVAVLSGRSLDQLDALLGDFTSAIAVAGSHGAERRLPGEAHATTPPPALVEAMAALDAVAAAHDLLLERKTMGGALHYRHAPEKEGDATTAAARIAADHGLVLQRGKMMVEVRAPGDKGKALAALLATPAMRGLAPLFFGDDVTDEDGFTAAAAAGGAGVLVGAPRLSAATYRVDDPTAVLEWIDAAVEAA